MTDDFLIPLSKGADVGRVGGKAAQLQTLQAQGARVPLTFVCEWGAYEAAMVDETAVLNQLRREISQKHVSYTHLTLPTI